MYTYKVFPSLPAPNHANSICGHLLCWLSFHLVARTEKKCTNSPVGYVQPPSLPFALLLQIYHFYCAFLKCSSTLPPKLEPIWLNRHEILIRCFVAGRTLFPFWSHEQVNIGNSWKFKRKLPPLSQFMKISNRENYPIYGKTLMALWEACCAIAVQW